MTTTVTAQIQLRRDTASNWISNDPILALGEIGYETDTQKQKIGDGATSWSLLDYYYRGDAQYAPIANGVTNGDSHDHSGGDGAQIAYSGLSGLPTLGSAAATDSTAYEAAGAIATHAALTTTHGISSFGATLVDDSDAATARSTLGLGTAATTASTDYATAAQGSTADTAIQPGDDAADLGSASATDGYVLTADGVGGSAWEAIVPTIEIVAPATYYSVVGVEASIWFSSLLKEVDGTVLLNWNVSGSVGKHIEDRWTHTPTDTTGNGTTLTVSIYTPQGSLITSHNFLYKVAAANEVANIILLYIGDSTVASTQILGDLADYATADTDLTLTLIGTQDTGTYPNEGYSGSSISWHYSNASSPFVSAGLFNFANYLSVNSFTAPNAVVIQLGTNDVFSKTTDSEVLSTAATAITQLSDMISQITTANPLAIVLLNLVIRPSSQTAMGDSYGVGQTEWRYKRNTQLWNKAMIDYAWPSSVVINPVNLNIDTTNGMANGVHPNDTGYQDIADAVYAALKNLAENFRLEAQPYIDWWNSAYNYATLPSIKTYGSLSGTVLTSTHLAYAYEGVQLLYSASIKCRYKIKVTAIKGLGVTSGYIGILLWNSGTAVSYDLPSGSDGLFTVYIGNLNRRGSISSDSWTVFETEIDLTSAPDFTHIAIHGSGNPSGPTEGIKIDLAGTAVWRILD